MTTSLPQSVLNLVEMVPPEDILLDIMRTAIPDVPVQSLIEDDQTFPFILVRSAGSWGDWDGDRRFVDSSQVEVSCLCDGINADEDAALLSEAVRVVLRDSVNKVVSNLGHIVKSEMLFRPRRVSDWVTNTGPVQYAELPQGVVRYQQTHLINIRRSFTKPFAV